MPSDELIRLSGVQKKYGGVTALKNISLTVNKGEFVSLLGPSGCGKTTTLNLIAGFASVDEGDVRISGKSVRNVPPNHRNLGMVFQSYALFPHLTVVENVRFGLRMKGIGKAEGLRKANEALSLVRLGEFGERGITELSGGQRQRVALARAIVTDPIALLLDEPLSALDANLREEMRSELREIQQRTQIATILVTHDQEEALALSDKIIVMRGGEIEQSGTPLEIYNSSANAFVANFVGESNLIEAVVKKVEQTGIVVSTASGLSFTAQTSARFERDQSVKVAIRPEVITLGDLEGCENSFGGVVKRLAFLGAVTKAEILVNQQIFSVKLPNTVGQSFLQVGDKVRIAWKRENMQVLHG